MRRPGRTEILLYTKPRTEPRHFATVQADSLDMTTRVLISVRSYILRTIPDFYRCLAGVEVWGLPNFMPVLSWVSPVWMVDFVWKPAYRKPKFERWCGSKYNKVHLSREYRTSALYEFLLQFPRNILDVYRIQDRYHRLRKAVSSWLEKDVSYPPHHER